MEDKKMEGGLMKHTLQTLVRITPAYSGKS